MCRSHCFSVSWVDGKGKFTAFDQIYQFGLKKTIFRLFELRLPRQCPHRTFDYDSFYSQVDMQHIDSMVMWRLLNIRHLFEI